LNPIFIVQLTLTVHKFGAKRNFFNFSNPQK
jgi:hypothetical protein